MRCRIPAECLLVGLLWLWSGCSAPHDNPRDPASPYYTPPDSERTPLAVVLTAKVYSVHISRIFPTTDSYSVIAELSGQDAALQDSALVAFDSEPPLSLVRIDPGTWTTIFSASYFQDPIHPNLGNVVGRPFLFYSYDSREADSVQHQIGPAYMWRVIEGVPQVISPTDTVTVDTIPTFVWHVLAADFALSYEISVVNQTNGFETTIWTSPMLTDTVVSYPDSIPDGDYYWTVTAEDSFDNSSRSKEGPFKIQWPQGSPSSSRGASLRPAAGTFRGAS